MKCSLLCGGLGDSFYFLIFKVCLMVFRWGQSWGLYLFDFMKVLKMVIWVRVGLVYVQLCMQLSDISFCEFQYLFR